MIHVHAMLRVAFQEKIEGAIIKQMFCGYLEDNEDENICQTDGDLEKRGRESKEEFQQRKETKRETKIKKKKYIDICQMIQQNHPHQNV